MILMDVKELMMIKIFVAIKMVIGWSTIIVAE